LKIGLQKPKLLSNIKQLTFLEHGVLYNYDNSNALKHSA